MNNKHYKSFLKKFISYICIVTLILTMFPAYALAENANNDQSSASSSNETINGILVPLDEAMENAQNGGTYTLLDRSNIKYNVDDTDSDSSKSNKFSGKKGAATLPSSVDLRDYNGINEVTSVKNQGHTGTCWAFAANAVSETNIASANNSSASEISNMSPFQTAYFGISALSLEESDLVGTEKSQASEGTVWSNYGNYKADYWRYNKALKVGGTTSEAASLLFQGVGVAKSSDIDFSDTSYIYGTLDTKYNLSSAQRRMSVATLSKWSYLGSLVNTKEETTGDSSGETKTVYDSTNEAVLDRAKSELASGKAIELSYYGDAGGAEDAYISEDTCAQYTYEYKGTNHAVCVVGYDDNYSRDNFLSDHKPPKDGAFIVKNSWGSGWGNSGYFYLSYWDQSTTDVTTYEYNANTYDGNYIDTTKEITDQYDYMPALIMYFYGSQSEWESNTAAPTNTAQWYSNVYTASQNQKLHSIGTYYCSEGKTLSYKIYKLKTDASTPADIVASSDTPDSQGTYSSDYEGFARIELSTPVTLEAGDKYAVCISQQDADGNYCAPQAVNIPEGYNYYQGNSVVNSGESFYKTSGSSTWKAMASNAANVYGEGINFPADNYCIKAYSTVLETEPCVVTFDLQGGQGIESANVTPGDTVTQPVDPTRDGYKFVKWTEDAAGQIEFDFDTAITDNKTLYAQWEVIDYNITYNLGDGATNPDNNPQTYNVETADITFADPIKVGYTFGGWYDASDNKVEGITKGSRTGNLELTAKWEATAYSITYKLGDGAKNASANPQTYTIEDETITLADPTRSGYEFLGWTGSNGADAQKNVTIDKGSTGEKTYTANWKVIDYNITYNVGDGATNPDNNPQTYNVETADITFADPIKTGYTFGGWFDASDNKIEGITKGSRTGNLDLSAKWTINSYTVKFVDWDDTVLVTEIVEHGKAATAPTVPPRTGYTFSGWSDDFSNITDNITIKAQYKVSEYKVTFDANGGNFEGIDSKEIDVKHNKTVTAPDPAPTRTGYNFVKWTIDAAGQTEFDFDTAITDNKTLYAQWEVIDYKITYNVGDGATNSDSNPKTYNVESADITFAAPTKDEYTFLGWFDADGNKVESIAQGSRTGDIELSAKWTKVIVSSFVIGDVEYIVQKNVKDVYIRTHSKSIKKLAIAKTVKDKYGNEYNVVGIAKAGFKNCKKLKKVSGGGNIKIVCAKAFSGCKKLKKVTISGKSLKTIGKKAFSGCKVLKKATFKSKNLKKIGKYAFAKTKKLTKITIKKTTKLKTVKKAFKKAGKKDGKKLTIKVKASKKKAYKKLILKKGGNKKLKVK